MSLLDILLLYVVVGLFTVALSNVLYKLHVGRWPIYLFIDTVFFVWFFLWPIFLPAIIFDQMFYYPFTVLFSFDYNGLYSMRNINKEDSLL